MSKQNYYQVDGIDIEFKSLKEAKHHCEHEFNLEEKIKYLDGAEVYNIVKGELYQVYVIRVDEKGNIIINNIE